MRNSARGATLPPIPMPAMPGLDVTETNGPIEELQAQVDFLREALKAVAQENRSSIMREIAEDALDKFGE